MWGLTLELMICEILDRVILFVRLALKVVGLATLVHGRWRCRLLRFGGSWTGGLDHLAPTSSMVTQCNRGHERFQPPAPVAQSEDMSTTENISRSHTTPAIWLRNTSIQTVFNMFSQCLNYLLNYSIHFISVGNWGVDCTFLKREMEG